LAYGSCPSAGVPKSTNEITQGKILDFRGGAVYDFVLLQYGTTSLDDQCPTFQDSVAAVFSTVYWDI
jgi:hypothetical protein